MARPLDHRASRGFTYDYDDDLGDFDEPAEDEVATPPRKVPVLIWIMASVRRRPFTGG